MSRSSSDLSSISSDSLSSSPPLEGRPSSGGSPSQATPRRKKKRSELDKLLDVLAVLREGRWTVLTLLEKLVEQKDHPRVRESFRKCRDYVGNVLSQKDHVLLDQAASRTFATGRGLDIICDTLQSEIADLSETASFGDFNPSLSDGSLDTIKSFAPTANEKAPLWWKILNEATRRANGSGTSLPSGRFVILMAQLCSEMHRNKCDNIPTLLGLYLRQAGCKRRGLELLNGAGLIVSYKVLAKVENDLAMKTTVEVSRLCQHFSCILTNDNFEYSERTRSERLGDKGSFKSITTALVFSGQGIPRGGIPKNWWNETATFKATELMQKLKVDGVFREVGSETGLLVRQADRRPTRSSCTSWSPLFEQPTIPPAAQSVTGLLSCLSWRRSP